MPSSLRVCSMTGKASSKRKKARGEHFQAKEGKEKEKVIAV